MIVFGSKTTTAPLTKRPSSNHQRILVVRNHCYQRTKSITGYVIAWNLREQFLKHWTKLWIDLHPKQLMTKMHWKCSNRRCLKCWALLMDFYFSFHLAYLLQSTIFSQKNSHQTLKKLDIKYYPPAYHWTVLFLYFHVQIFLAHFQMMIINSIIQAPNLQFLHLPFQIQAI